MMDISNDRDFRIGYAILPRLEKLMAENGGDPEGLVITLKRNLRQYAHRNTSSFDVGMGFICERHIVKDYGIDGYVELVSIPEVFDTLADDAEGKPGAETFFKDFLELHARPSMYDCTGQFFTNWYKIFRRRGRFMAYHSVGCDN